MKWYNWISAFIFLIGVLGFPMFIIWDRLTYYESGIDYDVTLIIISIVFGIIIIALLNWLAHALGFTRWGLLVIMSLVCFGLYGFRTLVEILISISTDLLDVTWIILLSEIGGTIFGFFMFPFKRKA